MANPEEYRRIRRIVDLVLLIANQPERWTRRDLADRYEVSEKQMDRDLCLVRHGLVMPLRHSRRGYFFENLATLPSLTLSLPEALSLLLAARLGQQMPGVSSTDLAAAIARLETLLPSKLQSIVGSLARKGEESGARESLLRDLQLAVAEGAQLKIVYMAASHERQSGAPLDLDLGGATGDPLTEPEERVVDPYTLLPNQKSWYLVGLCHLRGEIRMFKLDRIQSIARTGESFVIPEDFDLSIYQGKTWGLLWGEAGEPEEVVVEFSADAGPWVRDEEWHHDQWAEDMPDGSVRMHFQAGITRELRRWALGFGRQARVIRPESLAEWVREEAREMVEAAVRSL